MQQKQFLVSELKDVVDNYEAYELESPKDYGEVLSLLTGIFNEEWLTNHGKQVSHYAIIDDESGSCQSSSRISCRLIRSLG